MTVYAAQLPFAGRPGRAGVGVRRVKAAFLSGCESHPVMLLQPEAIGAVMEATKWLKPLV
jgi:hypothetical protein